MGSLGQSIVASSIVIVVLLVVMMLVYTLTTRKKMKKQQEFFQDLHAKLAPGKQVMFAGGLYGVLTKVGNEICEVRVKSGEVLEVSRYAIQEVKDK